MIDGSTAHVTGRIETKLLARALGAVAVLLLGCNGPQRVTLDYELAATLDVSSIVRVETRVVVDPSDPRTFTAALAYRSVDVGVGYEVTDPDADGKRTVLITHDASLGYVFQPTFSFTLLPPVGDAPPLQITAQAFGANLNQVLAQAPSVMATFGSDGKAVLALADERCGASACVGNDSCCGGGCTDTSTDVNNCGGCGNACGASGDGCQGSACQCNGGSACSAGQTCCPGLGCVDTQTSAKHCGTCGNSCATGESCVAGSCKCGNTSCSGSDVCCSGTCMTGGCACGGAICTAGAPLCCGTSCTNTQTDGSNCGGCNNVCAAGLHCSGGECKCPGAGLCGPSDTCCTDGCRNTDTSLSDCGACGVACTSGETCSAAACHCGGGRGCADDNICCTQMGMTNRICVDSTRDAQNCGGCGNACPLSELCVSSMCSCPGTGMACGVGQTCCPSSGCYDTSTDRNHCGDCSTVCSASQICSKGSCVTGTTTCPTGCPNGTTCKLGQCYCGTVQTTCTGQTCCAGSGGCVDTNTDVHNCGGCGVMTTQSKPLCCNGQLTASNALNCGTCGNNCINAACCPSMSDPSDPTMNMCAPFCSIVTIGDGGV